MREEIKTLRRSSLFRRVLNALGKDSGFKLPQRIRGEKHPGISSYHAHYDFHKELKNAMLEAERLKAKGIMEHQRRKLAR